MLGLEDQFPMKTNWMRLLMVTAIAALGMPAAKAHCDALDGPVVKAALKALDSGSVNPALAWVHEKDEAALRAAFDETIKVRAAGPAAKALADKYFLETIVRLHRMGEGAPYTGLKPAGGLGGTVILDADNAIASGSADRVIAKVRGSFEQGAKARFAEVNSRKSFKPEDAAAGRAYVAAYVDFLHYVQGAWQQTSKQPAAKAAEEHQH